MTSRPLPMFPPTVWGPRVVATTLGLGLAVAAGTFAAHESSRDLALVALAALVGFLLVVLAFTRFEAFVLTLLALRASVDWTKAPSAIGEPTRPGAMSTAIALLFLAAGAMWLLVQVRTGRFVPPSLLSLAWSAFVVIALISAVAADRRLESLAEWGRIATAVGMLLVLQQMLGRGGDVRRVLTACFVSALVPLGLAAYQAAVGGAIQPDAVVRVHGTFAHANAFGFYLVLLLVMGLSLLPHVGVRVRPLLLVLLWGAGAALVVTYSRGSWVAFLAGLVVVGVLQSPRLIPLVLGLAAVVVLSVAPVTGRILEIRPEQEVAGVEGNSLAWRFDHWGTVTRLADASPIIGIGPKMTQYVTDSAKVPHNDYLRAYVETGILGLCAYAAVVAALIHTARNALSWAPPGFGQGVAVGFAGCTAAFLIFGVAENLMSQVAVLWYFAAFAAAAVTVSRWPPDPGGVQRILRRPSPTVGSAPTPSGWR